MSQQRRQKKQLSSFENVSSLSDQELREALKSYNQTPGPITESTRNLYRKKLASLIEEGQSEPLGIQEIKKNPDKSKLSFLSSPVDWNDDDDTSDEDFNIQEEESDDYDDDEEDEDEEEEDDDDDDGAEEEDNELAEELSEDVKLSSTTHESDTTLTSVVASPDAVPNRISRVILMVVGSFFVALFALYLYTSNNQKLLAQLQPFRNITKQLLVLVAFSPIGYGIYRIISFYRARRHQEMQRVSKLVTEALELLQSPDNPKGLMPILHIRDTLLTPSERKAKKMAGLWKQAVKFIEEHESRVKVELVNIDGEDFRAWKWIGSKKL